MKKVLLALLIGFMPLIAFAQDAVVVPSVTVPFSWKVLVQQLLTNGGLALLAFLSTKIPGVFGAFVKSILDWLSANLEHDSKDNKK